jgi:hypothetical protein
VGASNAEVARELPGYELVPGGRRTTYAITIDAPPEQAWAWLVQIGRGRAGFYTYTWIERILGADIDNLDFLDPRLQTLKAGDRVWMTPERYLGRLPGQFWRVRSVEPGRALVMDRQPPDSALSATWTLVVGSLPDGRSRLIDRHRGERSAGVVRRASDTFWNVGTLLMERRHAPRHQGTC